MLSSLSLALSLLGLIYVANAAPSFTEIVIPSPPFATMWTPRTGAGLAVVRRSSTTFSCYNQYTGRTTLFYPNSYMVLFGGTTKLDGQLVPVNDVWISDLSGKSWCFAAGCTETGITHPEYANTFEPASQASIAVSRSSTVFLSGGIYQGLSTNTVWMSTGSPIKWSKKTSQAPWSPRYQSLTVFDSNDYLTLIGGFNDKQQILNDCWVSLNSGISWYQLTASAPSRSSAALVSATLVKSMYYLGGTDTNRKSFLNDVWQLAEQSKDFKQITDHAAFPARASHVALVANKALFVLGGNNGTDELNDGQLIHQTQLFVLIC